tara:strand:- start:151 stop:294 length:144 start_codon:yes stop_codon:yes gene_type:complete
LSFATILYVVVGVVVVEGEGEGLFFAIGKTIAKTWRCYKSVVKCEEL